MVRVEGEYKVKILDSDNVLRETTEVSISKPSGLFDREYTSILIPTSISESGFIHSSLGSGAFLKGKDGKDYEVRFRDGKVEDVLER